MHVVICGGGVIGTACAYELTRRGADVTLLERWRIGGCASGKSGGFLARDWCDGTPVAELAQRSFDLHEVWAEQLGNPYGYRKVDTFSAAMRSRAQRPTAPPTTAPALANWLAPEAVHRRQLGNASTTAALDPAAFTNALMQTAVAGGATLRISEITGLTRSGDTDSITGVELEGGETLSADAVILALGPWSLLAAGWLPLAPVYGLKGHSIIFKPENPLPAEAIFAEIEDASGEVHGPEIVSRADGTVYVCGLPGTGGLPVDPSQVQPEDSGCEKLRDLAVQLVPALRDAMIVAEQACYRPVTADGMPLIGPVAGHSGAYLATGHSVWGMLNAPGTAEALAELILDGTSTHVRLDPFAPSRLSPLDPANLEIAAR